MLDPEEFRKVVDTVKHELEETTLCPADSEVTHFRQQLAQDIAKALPDYCSETVHTVIVRSFQPLLTLVLSRAMAGAVEQAMRPLTEELARLRRFIEADSESDNWWRRDRDPDQEPDPDDGQAA